jgi:hypothetical protein
LDRTAGRLRLPAYERGFVGSLHYSRHGSRIAFERHTGTPSQYWAIDNLAQFIKTGRDVLPDLRSPLSASRE